MLWMRGVRCEVGIEHSCVCTPSGLWVGAGCGPGGWLWFGGIEVTGMVPICCLNGGIGT